MDFSKEYDKPIGYDQHGRMVTPRQLREAEEKKSKTLTSPNFKKKLASLYLYLKTKLGIQGDPLVKIVVDKDNQKKDFGFTAYYDHTQRLIVLYVSGRHDTDVLRSFAHEVIHHWQNELGTLHPEENPNSQYAAPEDNSTKAHYAQENPWLRRREMEAYLFGNILFRDWQDEQRHGVPAVAPTLPQRLDENLVITDGDQFRAMVEEFVDGLVSAGVFSTYHRNLTSGDMQAKDFVDNMVHKIMSAINEYIETVNDRGDWENDESGGMIHEVVCKHCLKPFDYNLQTEVAMGAVNCPNCLTTLDQEGKVLWMNSKA